MSNVQRGEFDVRRSTAGKKQGVGELVPVRLAASRKKKADQLELRTLQAAKRRSVYSKRHDPPHPGAAKLRHVDGRAGCDTLRGIKN